MRLYRIKSRVDGWTRWRTWDSARVRSFIPAHTAEDALSIYKFNHAAGFRENDWIPVDLACLE